MIVRAMLMVVIVTLSFSGMTTGLIQIIFKEIFGGCGRTTEQCVVPQHYDLGRHQDKEQTTDARAIKSFFIEIPNFWPWVGKLGR